MDNITEPYQAEDIIMLVCCKLRGLAALASIGELSHSGLDGLDVLFSSLADELDKALKCLDEKESSTGASNLL